MYCNKYEGKEILNILEAIKINIGFFGGYLFQ